MELGNKLKQIKILKRWYRRNINKVWMIQLENFVVWISDILKPYKRCRMTQVSLEVLKAVNLQEIASFYLDYLDEKQIHSNGLGYIIIDRFFNVLSGDLLVLCEAISMTERWIKVAYTKGDIKNKSVKNYRFDEYALRKFKADLIRCKYEISESFGSSNNFYQSYEPLKLRGQRDSSERIEIYGLDEYLDERKEVLDIGCNCGFFDILIAPKVKSILGVEYAEGLLKFGNDLKLIEEIQNVDFICGDFKKINLKGTYDIVLSFAVHHWIGLPLNVYFSRLRRLVKDDGIVLFETHSLDREDVNIQDHFNGDIAGLFEIVRFQKFHDKGLDYKRIFYYLKPIV